MKNAEQLICRLLRGEPAAWPGADERADMTQFTDLLRFHGVAMLVAQAFANDATRQSWPAAIVDHCREQALAQAVSEMAGRTEIARVLHALAGAGIQALLLKGGSLAYSHYANPVLRPRGDWDLLVPRSARRKAEDVLRQLGYAPYLQVTGEFVSYQASWFLKDGLGMTHELDLHWRIHNSALLAKLLDYDELAVRANRLGSLCADALAPAPVHALLFACLHLAGHRSAPLYMDGAAHAGGDRLIWLYDIHLLISAMAPAELEEFAALAVRKRMAAVCRDALVRSMECFGTRIPHPLLQQLRPTGTEPSARYCNAGPARRMADDFLALEGIGAKVRLLGELLFPPAAYMRAKYQGATVSWLPLLYARRALHALWRLAAPRAVSARARD